MLDCAMYTVQQPFSGLVIRVEEYVGLGFRCYGGGEKRGQLPTLRAVLLER